MVKLCFSIGIVCWLILATINAFQGDWDNAKISIILSFLNLIALQNEVK
jgi:hypothetical protein